VLDGTQRWFGPYTQYNARTQRSLAPQVAGTRGLVVVEKEQRLGTVIGQTLRDNEIVSVPTIEKAMELINGQGAIALVVNTGPGWEAAAPGQDAISLMSPLTLAQRQSLSFDIPIFACSVPERHVTLARLGVEDYLTKPISRERLHEAVTRYVPPSGVILVADDDVEARQLFGRMLVSMGNDYVVLDAEDGQETLEVMKERLPDLVLLDLIMPRKTGYDVLQERAEEERIRHIPVVIISAKDMEEEPVLCPGIVITRPEGLPLRDLALTIQAVSGALQPRFARLAQPQNPDAQ
jgi:CheY-like chemotaxis protein